MLIYKTYVTNEFGQETVSFQGSQTEANKARSAAKKEDFKAETKTIEVPTNKAGLLEWLNANVKG